MRFDDLEPAALEPLRVYLVTETSLPGDVLPFGNTAPPPPSLPLLHRPLDVITAAVFSEGLM